MSEWENCNQLRKELTAYKRKLHENVENHLYDIRKYEVTIRALQNLIIDMQNQVVKN